MSVQYPAIGWNPQKRIYDSVLLVGVLLYLSLFAGLGALVHPNATLETLLIRALGTAAFLLLHIILCIGPLCRLDRQFLPLLYNRRHLGVTMFFVALAHGVFSLIQFHGGGDVPALVSLLVSNRRFASISQFPFQLPGLLALVILFLMAATSHDFWLRNLSPRVWKALHMLVYAAYAMLVLHVSLGALQSERSPWLAGTLGLGMFVVISLHLAAASCEWRKDHPKQADRRGRRTGAIETSASATFVDIGPVSEISEKCARVVSIGGERVAVFRYDGKISAVSNVCQHQNGPLGEGRIIDGCITCPWHGYQYRPEDGRAPSPFKEKIPTFRTQVVDGRVLVHSEPLEPGTYCEPSRFNFGDNNSSELAIEIESKIKIVDPDGDER